MKGDRTKFFAGEQYVMSKVRVLFAINAASLGLVWFALYLSLSELLLVLVFKKNPHHTLQSLELITDLTLYSTRTENVHVK